jgi:catechol 2,3-dioxygenase-like lactoylglutathione lyase family enzyme
LIGNMHHVAVGVWDMVKAISFFTEVLGMEPDYTAHHGGENPSRISGVPDAALDVCAVKKGCMRIELYQSMRH